MKVRINGVYKTLVRYCECNRGAEWICVRGIYSEYNANVWEIWQRPALAGRKRIAWNKVTWCGSWAGMCDEWSDWTGQIIGYSAPE